MGLETMMLAEGNHTDFINSSSHSHTKKSEKIHIHDAREDKNVHKTQKTATFDVREEASEHKSK